MEANTSSVPTSQDKPLVEIMMEDAAIKELNESEQQELKALLEQNKLGLNVAMASTLKEIMEGAKSK